jgi:hypothetical protein
MLFRLLQRSEVSFDVRSPACESPTKALENEDFSLFRSRWIRLAGYFLPALCYVLLESDAYFITPEHAAIWVGAASYPFACLLDFSFRTNGAAPWLARYIVRVVSFSIWMPIAFLAWLAIDW